ncbi:uncharacterized protein [Diadema antillarum]|uniref:uncharacterized protein n=1 Tax=Diadema antillarum TaxID=105358 RepID=UPI003A8A8B85
MGVFHKCQFVLDFDASRVSYKVRQGLKNKILQDGGMIGYTVSRKTTHMVIDEGSKASFSYKTRKAQKLNIPIVGMSYIDDCLSSSRLLNPASYLIVDTQAQAGFGLGKIVGEHV